LRGGEGGSGLIGGDKTGEVIGGDVTGDIEAGEETGENTSEGEYKPGGEGSAVKEEVDPRKR
jgi:hypothetical protein